MLRDDRSLIFKAIEEILRCYPLVQLDGRHTFENIEIEGFTVCKEDSIMALLAGEDRDPAISADSETFNDCCDDVQFVPFASDIYFFFGAVLPRLECQFGLNRLLERFDCREIIAQPAWHSLIAIRGVELLDMRFG